MKKDNIWIVLDDPKGQSKEPDDIFAGMNELTEITDEELPF
ncbi:hypothetical protein [Bacillus paramycoides]|nr:hypothetical protein [Bacillus paramycoides]